MATAIHHKDILDELAKVGIHVPPNAISASLVMAHDSIVVLRFDVPVTSDDLMKVAIALGSYAQPEMK